MSNIKPTIQGYKDRFLTVYTELREHQEIAKEGVAGIASEMKAAGFAPEDIAGAKEAAKRKFESEKRRAARRVADQLDDQLNMFSGGK